MSQNVNVSGLTWPVVLAVLLAWAIFGTPTATRLSDTTYRVAFPNGPTRICTIGKEPMCVAIDESVKP
jgi:hypothetical protein